VFWATRIMPLSVLSVAAWRNVIDRSHDWRGRNWFRMRRRHCTPTQSEGKRKDQGKQRLSQFGTPGESRPKALVHVQSTGFCLLRCEAPMPASYEIALVTEASRWPLQFRRIA
jgi:hypothetical protein